MSDIYVFGSNEENNDYSTMGLVGALTPTECTFDEEANGESKVTLTHPLDEFGKHIPLKEGNILVVPVPVRTTPEIQNGACVTTVWTYEAKPANQLTSWSQLTLYKKRTGSGKRKVIPPGTIITVFIKSEEDNVRWGAKTPYGAGWIDPNGYTLKTEHVIADNSGAIEEIQSPWAVTDQYFRIYEVQKTLTEVKVTARHIRYDLLYNMTRYYTEGAATLQVALDGVLDNCFSTHDFHAHTNVSNEQSGLFYRLKNPIDAFLDPEDGICARYDVGMVSDNYDLYFLHDPGINRGIRIQYGKNMTGIDFTSSEDELATRIVPVGEKKDGTPLFLSETPGEQYIDSSKINLYSIPHVYELKCDNCKIGDRDQNGGTISEVVAKARMRQQAQDLLSGGCDEPKITMKVEFVNLGDTQEYSQFKNLENCFLFDYILVQHPNLDINVTSRIVAISWNCMTDQMKSVTIGSVGKTLANTGITSWQIPSGFSGSKIGDGTIGGGALKSDIINARHIQTGSVNAEAINAGSITAEKIATGVISTEAINAIVAKLQEIEAASLSTDALYAGIASIVRLAVGSITAETITTDTLAAVLGEFMALYTTTAGIDLATIRDMITDTAIIRRGLADELYIDRLSVTDANIVGVSANKITAGRIDAAEIEVVNLNAQNITVGTINGQQIGQGTITGGNIAPGAITTELIAAGCVTPEQLASGSVTADKLALGAVTADRLNLTKHILQ